MKHLIIALRSRKPQTICIKIVCNKQHVTYQCCMWHINDMAVLIVKPFSVVTNTISHDDSHPICYWLTLTNRTTSSELVPMSTLQCHQNPNNFLVFIRYQRIEMQHFKCFNGRFLNTISLSSSKILSMYILNGSPLTKTIQTVVI